MFKLVGIMGNLFAVQDTDDEVIDILPKGKICKCLNLGLQIGGITQISPCEFEYSDEYFPKTEEDKDEYDEDYGYNDVEFEDDEDEDSYGDDYNSDDFDDGYSDEGEDSGEDSDEDSGEDDYNSDEFDDGYSDEGEDYGDDYDNEDEEEYDEAFDDGYSDEDFGVEEEEVSTVNKLYSHLNDEQIKLLKRYYLWFSQRIFDEGQKQKRTLQVTNNPRKLQKQKELNAMRNQGGMWAYAGFIDMGYRGADYCTMGHPLRYVHLAWDISVSDIETSFFGESYDTDIEVVISSNNCIKFGIDCISDFFEIDKEYTDKLRRAQREAIKDMDFMCQYYEEGTADKVIASFTVTDELVNNIAKIDAKGLLVGGEGYECIVPKSLSSFYRQFRQLNLIVPKSLVQEIRDNLIGWTVHKFTGWREPNWGTVDKVLNAVVGTKTKKFDINSYSQSGYKRVFQDYLVEFLQLKSCGYYEYNAENFKEEGGASKPVKSQLWAIHNSVKKKFWADAEYTFDYIRKLLDLEVAMAGLSELVGAYSTPTASYNSSENIYYMDTAVLDLNSRYIMEYDEKNDTKLYGWTWELKSLSRCADSMCRVEYNKNYNLVDFLDLLNEKIQLLENEKDKYFEFATNKVQEEIDDRNEQLEKERSARLARLEKERKEAEEREKARQAEAEAKEKASKLSDEEIRQYCIDNASKVKDDKKLKFALTVLDTVKKTGKCSPKQMYYIGQIYEKLTGVQVEDKRQASKVQLDARKDIEQAIDTVLEDPSLLENQEDKEKVYAILTSIKKYRTISERQMKYAEIALKVTEGE